MRTGLRPFHSVALIAALILGGATAAHAQYWPNCRFDRDSAELDAPCRQRVEGFAAGWARAVSLAAARRIRSVRVSGCCAPTLADLRAQAVAQQLRDLGVLAGDIEVRDTVERRDSVRVTLIDE